MGLSAPSSTTRRLGSAREQAGRVRRRPATRRPPPRPRTAAWPRRSSRSRSRSARATRSWSTPTRACGPVPRWSALAPLRPAFTKDGTITAGNASQISDGGAAVVADVARKALSARASRRSGSRLLRDGGRTGQRPLLTAARAGDPQGARQGRQSAGDRRPVRDQRGVRRRRAWPRWTSSASTRRSSTSTVGRSRSATRSG